MFLTTSLHSIASVGTWLCCWLAGSKGPEGVLQDQSRGSLASCRMEIKHELRGSESRIYWGYRKRVWIQTEILRDLERKVILIFAQRLGFLLRIVVWYTCPLRHPGTKSSVWVFSICHLCPQIRGLDESVFLKNVHGEPVRSFLRCCYLLWEDSKEIFNSLTFTRRTYFICLIRHV